MRQTMVVATLLTVWIPSIAVEQDSDAGLQEIITCEDEKVHLRCPSPKDLLLVREASFFETGRLCRDLPPPPPPKPRDPDIASLRHSLLGSVNRKCAGKSQCHFYRKRDRPNVWRPGIMYISYTCKPGDQLTRYCSEVVTAPDGLLVNPGYPYYYLGSINCTWVVRADQGRRIRIGIHDLNIRGPLETGSCEDFLRVTDGKRVLFMNCGDLVDPVQVTSFGSEVMVTLWAKGQRLNPFRGALVQYTAVGCSTLAPPTDGYLVQRNASHALYTCCVNFVFGDTRLKERQLTCSDVTGWNDTVPERCVDIRVLEVYVSSNRTTLTRTAGEDLTVSPSPPVQPVVEQADAIFVDMVLPLVVLIALIIGNAVVIVLIYKYRQRNQSNSASSSMGMSQVDTLV